MKNFARVIYYKRRRRSCGLNELPASANDLNFFLILCGISTRYMLINNKTESNIYLIRHVGQEFNNFESYRRLYLRITSAAISKGAVGKKNYPQESNTSCKVFGLTYEAACMSAFTNRCVFI